MDRLDLAVLDDERVPLPAHAPEDGVRVESQVERPGELARRISEEPELCSREQTKPKKIKKQDILECPREAAALGGAPYP